MSWLRLTATSNTAPHIHISIRHIQSVWAHWYAVNGEMVVASNSYTHTTWLRFWGSDWVTCGVIMMSFCQVEADSHLKLLPTSTLIIYKVFKHIDMLSMGICQKHQTVIPTPLVLLRLWTCGVKMMSLPHGWGWQPTQTSSDIIIRKIQHFWAHWYAVNVHMAVASTDIPTLLLGFIVQVSYGWRTDREQTASWSILSLKI